MSKPLITIDEAVEAYRETAANALQRFDRFQLADLFAATLEAKYGKRKSPTTKTTQKKRRSKS